jgi:oligopeptide/dipeptide ABC transporter ATP-binding protein
MTPPFLTAEAVSKRFSTRVPLSERLAMHFGRPGKTRVVHAVNEVSLAIARGEVLGLVGESGCGKSTLGRMLTGIIAPSSGRILLNGESLMSEGPRPAKIDRRVQMVFQNPYASLNPRMRIGRAIAEGPIAHGLVTRSRADDYVAHWLTRVGLDPSYASRYPHQFSGGQRQRVAIARALAMQPEVLVCDEPVASLDVSIQAQIVNLFLSLRREMSLTMLFISHDLGVVKHLCDRVAVMYLGQVVEVSPTPTLYEAPLHPYTRALLASVPQLRLDEDAVTFHPISGELPSPLAPPSGCAFHTRCPLAQERCLLTAPRLISLDAARQVACHVTEDAHLGRDGNPH